LQQLDWNGSNVGYVVVKLSIHLQSTKFFLSRMCTALFWDNDKNLLTLVIR